MDISRGIAHRPRFIRFLIFSSVALISLIILLGGAGLVALNGTAASSSAPTAMLVDNCLSAEVINPASLPFSQDSTTEGAANDLDPGQGGCASGLGPDVVFSFTPATSGPYVLGATPFGQGFDISLYVITDCDNPAASCVAGANARGFNQGENLTAMLTAGTQYFIVVDSPQQNGAGSFHFTLRRVAPDGEDCSVPTVIQADRLPFIAQGTTFGTVNDLNPGTPCLRSQQSGSGPDVVFQFTPVATQSYVITATPVGNYDLTTYVVSNCNTFSSCRSGDSAGAGLPEVIQRGLTAGTTYFIVVDGFQGDAGDFTLKVEPVVFFVPAAPTNLVATVVSEAQIDLSWKDNSDNEFGFRIERSLDGFNFTEIGSVGPNVTTFSDTTVSANTTYFYRVMAFNSLGNSSPSNIADATTPPPPPPPVPVIGVSPDSIDFGSVEGNQPATRPVVVSNSGSTNLVISAITGPGSPFSLVDPPQLPATVAPEGSLTLTVRFAPTAAQVFTGAFTIESNDPDDPFVTVNLRGVGTSAPVPNLEISPTLVDFSSGSGSMIIEVKNSGNAVLLISRISNPAPPFSMTGPSAPLNLEPGQGIILTIGFFPPSPGVFQGSFDLVTNDPDQLLTVVRLRGTSTSTNEQLKLRAPTLVTAVAGSPVTLNVLASNGTNTDIQLQASPVPGATFTDRGGGRGDLVYTPPAEATGTVRITFTARDSANRVKTVQSAVTILPSDETHQVEVAWTAPETASNPPTGVVANDLSITPLGAIRQSQASLVEPAVAPGLIGYVIYRSLSPDAGVTLSNIVGVAPANAASFIDRVPAPATSSQTFFYVVTALYQTGTESGASNQTSNAPRMPGLQFKKKTVRFQGENSNVAVGAVLIVDGS
ncbi:MAG TPA: choice-of-anchor D domain-containing protein, partial [Blastocatellia bacterium]|nr:choice-of-anchor D domain-containing protein [Blastocatellia bacterium]